MDIDIISKITSTMISEKDDGVNLQQDDGVNLQQGQNGNGVSQETQDPLFIESFLEEKGRILIATADIEPGTVIFEDTAIVSAPDGIPVCLGCLKNLSDDCVSCSGCGWALCSAACSASPDHAHQCQLFQRNAFKPDLKDYNQPHILYSFLSVLSILQLKESNVENYEILLQLMDHWEERRRNPQVASIVKLFGAIARKKLNLAWVTDEAVQHAFGVLKTNAVGQGNRACYIYPIVSLLSHSCSSNAEIVGTPGKKITFRAKRKINKGDEITWSYTNILECKSTIRNRLKQVWLFDCCCERCRDNSEMGLFYSSLKCSCGGFYCNREGDLLACNNCSKTKTEETINEMNILNSIKMGSPDTLVSLISVLSDKPQVHETHFISTRLSMRLLDVLHSTDNDELREVLISRGKNLLNTLDLLDGQHSIPYKRYKTILSTVEERIKLIKK